MQLFND